VHTLALLPHSDHSSYQYQTNVRLCHFVHEINYLYSFESKKLSRLKYLQKKINSNSPIPAELKTNLPKPSTDKFQIASAGVSVATSLFRLNVLS